MLIDAAAKPKRAIAIVFVVRRSKQVTSDDV
jgi:hypothetical protein